MVLTCNLGCIPLPTTAIRLLPAKRFLASLALPMRCGVLVDIESGVRVALYVVRRDQ